jgi:arylsulfatase A-like enzyme
MAVMSKNILRAWLGLILFLVWGISSAQAAVLPEKPNFIFILADDMGYGDIGPFGSVKNRTPNLDRMAREGMKFTSFYAAPLCTPSRAQILTGCYAKRVSLPDVLFPRSRIGLNTNEHTIASLLKGLGYATVAIGKWHVGDDRQFLPTRHGFDHYLGLPYSNDMGGEVPGKDTDKWKNRVPPLPLVRDEKVVETLRPADQDKLTALYTEEAVKFIHDNKSRPFFLYLPHTAVHIPLHPGAKFRGKSANGLYGDWVEEIDWCVGRVMEAVRQEGLENRTLIVFSSDNGPWISKGTNAGNAGPLRGGKGGTFEGGIREPMIAWWPGQVAAGSLCAAVAANFDLLPTFVKLAGGTVPSDHKIDGRDITPLLLGQSTESPHEAFYYFASTSLQAVRAGEWKLALVPQYEGFGPYHALSADLNHPLTPKLYNLEQDLGEKRDVAAEHPEVVERLMSYAREMDGDLGVGKANGPGVRAPGHADNPKGLWLAGHEPASPSLYQPSDKLRIGDEIEPDEAPQIAGRSFRITCRVKPVSRNAVIVAQGGSRTGYSIYLIDGVPTFGVREEGKFYSVTAAGAPGKTYGIEAELREDGAMILSIDGQPAATGKAAGLITRQPTEALCVGFDNGAPVGKYKDNPTIHFKGGIFDLEVIVAGERAQP